MRNRLSALVILALVGTIVSCTEKPSDPGTGNLFDPSNLPPVPINVRLEVATARVTLSWDVADAAGVEEYRVYRAEGSGDFQFLGAPTPQTYEDDQVVNGASYRYQIAAVEDGLEGQRSVTVSAIPNVFSLVLEGGAEVTSANAITPGSRKIRVDLVAPAGTISYQLSEDAALAGAPVQGFGDTGASAVFTLSPGDGPKTVYGRFTGEGGSVSEVVSGTIRLDTRAVIESVTEDSNNQVLRVNDVLHIAVTVDEAGGDVEADIGDALLNLRLFDDGSNGDAVAFDGVYERDFTITAGLEVVDGVIVGSFRDDVGNQANDRFSATKVTVADPPGEVAFNPTSTIVSGSTIRLAWSQNQDNDFAEYRVYRSNDTNVNENDPVIATNTDQGDLTYTDMATPGTTFTWGVAAVDQNGFSSPIDGITRTLKHDPAITNTSLTPSVGNTTTTFQYECRYSHFLGVRPVAVSVIVDGTQIYPMTQVGTGTNWMGGETFRATANLAAGNHGYVFEAEALDGSKTRNPVDESVVFGGPLVN